MSSSSIVPCSVVTVEHKNHLLRMKNMDAQLTDLVNMLGVVIFTSLILYHLVVASNKDAK